MTAASATEAPARAPLLRRLALALIALMVVTIPLENVIVLATGSVTKLIGFAAFALGLIALFQGPRLRFRPPPMFLIAAALFVLWGIASYYWSLLPEVSLSRSVTYVQLLALAWVVWEYGGGERQRAVLMLAYLAGAYIAFGIGFSTFIRPDNSFRYLGSGLNANDFAVALALGIPMAWRLTFIVRNRLLHWLSLLYLPVAIAGVVMAASRGGFITSLIVLLLVPLTFAKLSVLRKAALFLLIALGVWTIFFYAPRLLPEVQESTTRIFQTGDELREGTLTGRRLIWAAGWQVYAEHPYLGIGLGGYRFAIAPIYGKAIVSHNAYLSALVELGPIGLMLFLAMFASVAFPILLQPRGLPYWFSLTILLGLATAIYSLSWEGSKVTWFVLALLAAEAPWIATLRDRRVPEMRGRLAREGAGPGL